MTLPSFEPFPAAPLQSALRPRSWLASPVPFGLERIPPTGPRLLVGSLTLYGGLEALVAIRDREPDRYPIQRLLRAAATRLG